MASLVLLQDGQAIPHSLIGQGSVLGRHPECEIQINSNMVSRKHARVFAQDGAFYIEDLGSGNGTFVNSRKIEGPTALNHEDRIKLGPILLRFESDQPAARTGSPTVVPRKPILDPMSTLGVDLGEDDEGDGATIMGQTDGVSGFGRLEVQPEAKLKAVLEISRSLAGTVDLNAILPRMLDSLFNIFPHADRGCVLLKDNVTGRMIPRAMKHRRSGDDETVKLSRTVLKTVLEQKAAVLSADATNDARFEASESISNLTIRSMMCVPLLSLAGEPMGVIHIDTQNAFNQFKNEDLDLLVAVAGQAALSYESAKLLVTAMEKAKQDSEMGIARDVQHALLPEEMPSVPGWEFFASYDSAQAVGGDYYDCLRLDDNRVCIAFGDVAGKGVPASLVMSRLSSVVMNVMAFLSDVGEAAARVNNQMCAKAVEGRFVTFVLGVLELDSGKFTHINAGHMPLMVRKPDGSIVEIGEAEIGCPLGVMEDYPYDVIQYVLAPGEMAVIYTDGVSEAMNPNSDLYGMERIREIVAGCNSGSAAELGKTLREDVRRHAAGRDQNDDITMMVFGRKG